MADVITLARPYAKALFAEALAHHLLDPWTQATVLLAAIVEEPKVAKLIFNPHLSDENLQSFFEGMLNDLNKVVVTELGQRLHNFIRLLVTEKRLMLLPAIARLYHQLLMQHQGVVEAEVWTAFPLSEQHREQIERGLEQRFRSKVRLNVLKDETLIGGVIVRVGNWVMDGSVKGKLQKLAESLL